MEGEAGRGSMVCVLSLCDRLAETPSGACREATQLRAGRQLTVSLSHGSPLVPRHDAI